MLSNMISRSAAALGGAPFRLNKTTGATVKNAIYTQLGINYATIDFAGLLFLIE